MLYISSQEELPEHYWLEKSVRVFQLKLAFRFMMVIFIFLYTKIVSGEVLNYF